MNIVLCLGGGSVLIGTVMSSITEALGWSILASGAAAGATFVAVYLIAFAAALAASDK